MKKILSQVTIGIICVILGFLLSYQIKYIINTYKSDDKNLSGDEAIEKLNELQIENEKLKENNKSLTDQIKSYETNSSGTVADDEAKKQIVLDKAILGTEEVSGSGIVITIQKKNATYDNNLSNIGEMTLSYIVNNLKFAGAEAISINDIRITAQTGIRTSGSFIRVGNTDRINPDEAIIIKVIGDSTKLKTEMEFQGFLENLIGNNYNASIETADSIEIEKTTDKITNDFLSVESEKGE